ncbi:MAG: hypothetical protein WD670_00900 [Actinomycetota bacterium]
MSVLQTVFGTALFATGTAGWVVNTRVNGNPFAALRDRATGEGTGLEDGEDYASVAVEGDEETAFSFEGKLDYKPGAKRRLIALGLLILLVGVIGALVAAFVGFLVWLVNSAIVSYVTSG